MVTPPLVPVDSCQSLAMVTTTVLQLLLVAGAGAGCGLGGLEVVELPHFRHRRATAVLVSWEPAPPCSRPVQLTLVHRAFRGCPPGQQRDLGNVNSVVNGSNSVIVEDLHHFSNYTLNICFLPGCAEIKSLNFSTKESVPRVKVQESPLSYAFRDTPTQLTFSWRPALRSQCALYQSRLHGYRYQLAGPGLAPALQASLPLNTTQATLGNLLPASCYALFVFVTNSKDQFHEDYYLKIEKCTKEGKIGHPVDLNVGIQEGMFIQLFWNMKEPTLKKLLQFDLRWSPNETDKNITRQLLMKPSTRGCHLKEKMFEFCANITIPQHENMTVLFLSVRAVKGLEMSPWSADILVRMKREEKHLLATPGRIGLLVASFIVICVLGIVLARIGYKIR